MAVSPSVAVSRRALCASEGRGGSDRDGNRADHRHWAALAKDGETVHVAKTVRDILILTNRRLVRTDTQGLMSRKPEYLSIPSRGITRWSVETKGRGFKDGADLKLWLGAMQQPVLDIELQKDESAREVTALLTRHVL